MAELEPCFPISLNTHFRKLVKARSRALFEYTWGSGKTSDGRSGTQGPSALPPRPSLLCPKPRSPAPPRGPRAQKRHVWGRSSVESRPDRRWSRGVRPPPPWGRCTRLVRPWAAVGASCGPTAVGWSVGVWTPCTAAAAAGARSTRVRAAVAVAGVAVRAAAAVAPAVRCVRTQAAVAAVGAAVRAAAAAAVDARLARV